MSRQLKSKILFLPPASSNPMPMISLTNLTRDELTRFVVEDLGEPAFRARQLWQWLWRKGAVSFGEMTDLSKACRAKLAETTRIERPRLAAEQKSADGTVKLLLELDDGQCVETVLIPSHSREGKPRWSQCLSTQVGCAMGCTFCSTGSMGFVRNMSMAEILGQVLVGRAYLREDPDEPVIRNLVFMGMGEPLLNFRELMRVLETLNSEPGLSFSPRRITVSTCGIEKGLLELGQSGLAYLAVSLHAPTQGLRQTIMPGAARLPLERLLDLLRRYPLKARERLTFEYLLLGGVNDGPPQARDLARIMAHIKGKLNIILYNPAEGAPYKAPTPEAVEAFLEILRKKHITATLRQSKGADIKAACGQLRAEKADAVRCKPADLGIDENDATEAVACAQRTF